MLAGRIVRTPDPTAPARLVWRRRLARHSRSLHIWVSMFSCVVVLFFAGTGLTLNHPEWFADAERVTEADGQLNVAWARTGTADVAKLEIVEYLRSTHNLRGAVSDFLIDETQCSVSLKGPGYTADVFIDRETGTYQLTETRLGMVAVMNDLHKGRDSGTAWKAVVDISAVLLAFISLTGLVLMYFVTKHRVTGFLLLGIGGLATYLVFLTWVP